MGQSILSFIQKRFPKNCNWTSGNCYYFSLILKDRFPGGQIIYEPVVGHFMYKLENKCYDYLGAHKVPEFFYIWEELEKQDKKLYSRLQRDCLW